MDNHQAFAIWAPESSIWSPWVKPVLFSYLDLRWREPASFPHDLDWAPPAGENVALVIDIAGSNSALLGLELAGAGYRPIPLYNSVPLPAGHAEINPLTGRRVAAVDVLPILTVLWEGAEKLLRLQLPPKAPPAFLLDSNRHGIGQVLPDEFDNRSVSFTTDFPSAKFLRAQGIERALLVTDYGGKPALDLAHTLRRWQEAGISIHNKQLGVDGGPVPCDVPRPPRFRAMFQRALAAMGFRRGAAGGFGGWLPDPESSGGGG